MGKVENYFSLTMAAEAAQGESPVMMTFCFDPKKGWSRYTPEKGWYVITGREPESYPMPSFSDMSAWENIGTLFEDCSNATFSHGTRTLQIHNMSGTQRWTVDGEEIPHRDYHTRLVPLVKTFVESA